VFIVYQYACVSVETAFYTHGVWDSGLSVRYIFFMARRNNAPLLFYGKDNNVAMAETGRAVRPES